MRNEIRGGRSVSLVILFCSILLLSGCGGDEQETQEQVSSYVYVAKQLATSSSGGYGLPDYFRKPAVVDGELYFMTGYDIQAVEKAALPENDVTVEFDDTDTVICLSSSVIEIENDGGAGEEEILELLDRAMEAGRVSADGDRGGTAYVDPEKECCLFSLSDYAVDQEQNTYLAVEYSRGSYFAMESMGCVLCRRDEKGEWVYRRFFPGLQLTGDSLAVDGDGGLYVLTAQGLLMVDGNGRETGIADTQVYKGTSYSSERLLGDGAGNVYYFVLEEFDSRWKGMEVENRGGIRLKETGQLSGSEWLDTCAVFLGDVFFSVSDRFYLYDRAAEECGEILLWANSNLIGSYVRDVMPLSRERLLVWYEEPEMEGLYLLVKTLAEELPEREAVTLAAFSTSTELSNAVIRFNRMNGKYQVIVESYGYSGETAEGAQIRLDTALASADPPDLVSLQGRDLGRDVEKGLLEDLSPYLEASSMVDREDFLENALAGYTIGGSLVGIPVRFYVTAVGGRTSQVGKLESWTMEDVYTLAERYPEQTRLLNDALYMADTGKSSTDLETREHLLGSFCASYYLEEFVDWEKGECSFDSQGFRRLLVWVGEHTKESGEHSVSGRRTYSRQGYLPEDALLMESRLDFESAAIWEVQCGEEVTLLGYPTVDGRGTASVSPEAPLGIVAGAGNREGAWEFLEYYISSEKDTGLPTSRSRLQKLMEEAVKEESRAKKFQYLEGEAVPIYATSQEMAERLMDFLEEADFTPGSRLRDMTVGIILEESEAYYTGDKSLDEVVALIQNRVGLILGE